MRTTQTLHESYENNSSIKLSLMRTTQTLNRILREQLKHYTRVLREQLTHYTSLTRTTQTLNRVSFTPIVLPFPCSVALYNIHQSDKTFVYYDLINHC